MEGIFCQQLCYKQFSAKLSLSIDVNTFPCRSCHSVVLPNGHGHVAACQHQGISSTTRARQPRSSKMHFLWQLQIMLPWQIRQVSSAVPACHASARHAIRSTTCHPVQYRLFNTCCAMQLMLSWWPCLQHYPHCAMLCMHNTNQSATHGTYKLCRFPCCLTHACMHTVSSGSRS